MRYPRARVYVCVRVSVCVERVVLFDGGLFDVLVRPHTGVRWSVLRWSWTEISFDGVCSMFDGYVYLRAFEGVHQAYGKGVVLEEGLRYAQAAAQRCHMREERVHVFLKAVMRNKGTVWKKRGCVNLERENMKRNRTKLEFQERVVVPSFWDILKKNKKQKFILKHQ